MIFRGFVIAAALLAAGCAKEAPKHAAAEDPWVPYQRQRAAQQAQAQAQADAAIAFNAAQRVRREREDEAMARRLHEMEMERAATRQAEALEQIERNTAE